MPDYKAYPKEADTKSRKARKGERAKIFLANKEAGRKLRRARKEAREAALEAQEAAAEETIEE
jgi:hypothetical protein